MAPRIRQYEHVQRRAVRNPFVRRTRSALFRSDGAPRWSRYHPMERLPLARFPIGPRRIFRAGGHQASAGVHVGVVPTRHPVMCSAQCARTTQALRPELGAARHAHSPL